MEKQEEGIVVTDTARATSTTSHEFLQAPDVASLELRQKLAYHIHAIRSHLQEQCFWAYPPPMVDEGAGGVELYRRYKYGGKGRESRRWFRDYHRRVAASHMAEWFWLLAHADRAELETIGRIDIAFRV